MRAPRPVEVDAEAATLGRFPIVKPTGGYEFGEPGVAEVAGRRVRGVIGWDPRLGWVLVTDEPPERPDGGGEPSGPQDR